MKFNVGDKVRVNQPLFLSTQSLEGKIGIIRIINPPPSITDNPEDYWGYGVLFENNEMLIGLNEDELEKVI